MLPCSQLAWTMLGYSGQHAVTSRVKLHQCKLIPGLVSLSHLIITTDLKIKIETEVAATTGRQPFIVRIAFNLHCAPTNLISFFLSLGNAQTGF